MKKVIPFEEFCNQIDQANKRLQEEVKKVMEDYPNHEWVEDSLIIRLPDESS